MPAIVAAAGDGTARRFLEFFAVTIDNKNTRGAYFHACRRFFAWCDRREDANPLKSRGFKKWRRGGIPHDLVLM